MNNLKMYYENLGLGSNATAQITISTAVVNLLTALKALSGTTDLDNSNFDAVEIYAEDIVRYTKDGSLPTSTTGHVIDKGATHVIDGAALKKINFIKDSTAGGDAKLNIQIGRATYNG